MTRRTVTYLELWDQLGYMFTLFLWLDDTFLLWLLADDSLYNIVALLRSLKPLPIKQIITIPNSYCHLFVSTALGCAEFSGFLVTPSHRGVLGHSLGLLCTLLSWPLLTLLGGLVSFRDILALFFLNSLTADNIIFNLDVMYSNSMLWLRTYLSVFYVWARNQLESLQDPKQKA